MQAVITATNFADHDLERRLLEPAGFQVVVSGARTPEEIVGAARDADALLVQYAEIGADTLGRLPDLRIISRYGVGVDNLDVAAAARRGVMVTNVPSYGGDEVALHATSLILALIRHLRLFDQAVRAGTWHYRSTGPLASAADMTLGVLGLGRVGRVVAARGSAWFGHVVAHDPYASAPPAIEAVDLDDLFERSDAVSVHVPLTEETRELVDRRRLRLLGPRGYLVNTARGPIVHLGDLVDALDAGELAGAALDVLPNEPPGPEDAVVDHPRVLLTPHVGWYSVAAETDLRRTAARNILDWSRGSASNIVSTSS